MARARNIKPGFFTNDQLVELPMATRMLFIGLWTLADREGRLEDRPKKIKMEVFPADDIDVDEALSTLVSSAFIQRYMVDGVGYIQVDNFTKHQRPHTNESASVIPPPTKTRKKKARNDAENQDTANHGEQDLSPRESTRAGTGAIKTDTGYLNDDTPTTDSLIADTGLLDADSVDGADAPASEPSHGILSAIQEQRFRRWYMAYPRKVGPLDAEKVWSKIKPAPTDELTERMITKVREWIGSEEWSDPKYIPHPSTWLSRGQWGDGSPSVKTTNLTHIQARAPNGAAVDPAEASRIAWRRKHGLIPDDTDVIDVKGVAQ